MPGGYPPTEPVSVPVGAPAVAAPPVRLPVSPCPPVARAPRAPAPLEVEPEPEAALPTWLCAVDGAGVVGSCLATLSTAPGTSRPAGPRRPWRRGGGRAGRARSDHGRGAAAPWPSWRRPRGRGPPRRERRRRDGCRPGRG